MRGKAYAIMRGKDVIEISLSRQNAQEICMDYALTFGYYDFIHDFNYCGYDFDDCVSDGREEMDQWHIWEFNLV
jgi:hypothetical protein